MASPIVTVSLVLCAAVVCFGRMAYVLPSGADSLVPNVATTFSCEDRIYGYYADVDNDCRIFHVCLPIENELSEIIETAQFSFLCGNATVFSQESLTCVHEADALPCQDAPSLYDVVNSEFGKIPEDQRNRI